MRTVPELLARAGRRDARLHFDDATVTWGDIEADSVRAAAGLRALGVGPGDRVGLWLPNDRTWLVLLAACCRIGAIAVAVNTRFRRHEIDDLVRRLRPRVIAWVPRLGRADHAAVLAGVDWSEPVTLVQCGDDAAVEVPGVAATGYRDLLAAPPGRGGSEARGDQVCCIFLSSGTTGPSKFVMHRQDSVVRHTVAVARALELEAPGTMVMQALPFCGVFGFAFMVATMAAGASMIVPRMFDAVRCAGLAQRYRVTHMAGSDDMFARMLREGEKAEGGAERPFPDLRCCPYAQFNPALAEFPGTAMERGMPLIGPFGMSEVFSFFSIRRPDDPPDLRAEGGGHPVDPDAAVRVRDPVSGLVAEHGEVGEIEISSPTRFVGYFGDEDATRAAFTHDGWLRTGDLGTTAPDGSFTYLSRMGDALRLGGFLVNPLEIETRLCSHPEVADAQVVAVGTEGGARPVAFVVPRREGVIDEQALVAHCAADLAPFKVPVRCFAIAAFPVTESPNGTKIRKEQLRAMARDVLAPGSGQGVCDRKT